MPREIGSVVTEATLKKKGENQNGPWEFWKFKTDKSDKWFSVFPSKKKRPKPFKGMKIDLLEYEEKQDGEYTNYEVDEIKVSDDSPSPPPDGQPSGSRGPTGQQPTNGKGRDDIRTFFVAASQEALKAWLSVHPEALEKLRLDDYAAMHGYLVNRHYFYFNNYDKAVEKIKSLASIIGGSPEPKETPDPLKDRFAFIAEGERLKKLLGNEFDEIIKGFGYKGIEDVPDQDAGRKTVLDVLWGLEKAKKSKGTTNEDDPVGD